ncbi:TRAP-like protein, putative, fragment, pseudogene [Plasmodium gallinaceum]|uniref:TRAP-like protein, putative, fragment, pseudogene n=1 Tax=Plasmodium gallinaceum TaxID=5849 RepID=UPI00090FE7D9|nr:TRAP-like protein, putative, fragment, pseudogene [Plasmodium gallinaceum]CRG93526.1 TRAP-like protein, putative, fragment, pseudogene [Plasmodium gallinaceum]
MTYNFLFPPYQNRSEKRGKQEINEETKEHGKQEISEETEEHGKQDIKMKNDDDKEETFHSYQNKNDTLINEHQSGDNMNGGKQEINEETKEHGKQEISEETEEHGKQDIKMKNDDDKEETFHSYQNKNDTLINEHQSGDNMNGGKQVIGEETREHGNKILITIHIKKNSKIIFLVKKCAINLFKYLNFNIMQIINTHINTSYKIVNEFKIIKTLQCAEIHTSFSFCDNSEEAVTRAYKYNFVSDITLKWENTVLLAEEYSSEENKGSSPA